MSVNLADSSPQLATSASIERPGAVLPGPLARAWLLRLVPLVRGRDDDAAWVRPSVLGLLAITALLYLWNLGASGWANGFYSAAVQA